MISKNALGKKSKVTQRRALLSGFWFLWVFFFFTCRGDRTVITLFPSVASICTMIESEQSTRRFVMLYSRRPGLATGTLTTSLYP